MNISLDELILQNTNKLQHLNRGKFLTTLENYTYISILNIFIIRMEKIFIDEFFRYKFFFSKSVFKPIDIQLNSKSTILFKTIIHFFLRVYIN